MPKDYEKDIFRNSAGGVELSLDLVENLYDFFEFTRITKFIKLRR